MVYLTSDWHIFHINIIKYAGRPFEFSENGAKDFIITTTENYNSLIKDDDIIIFLGDMSMSFKKRKGELKEIIKNLKGNKILVRGNHDEDLSDEFFKQCGFKIILDHIIYKNNLFSHYACCESKYTTDKEKEHIKLVEKNNIKNVFHGHIHNKTIENNLIDNIKRINCCIDYSPNLYKPVLCNVKGLENYLKNLIKEAK